MLSFEEWRKKRDNDELSYLSLKDAKILKHKFRTTRFNRFLSWIKKEHDIEYTDGDINDVDDKVLFPLWLEYKNVA